METTVTSKAIQCDGCEYLVGRSVPLVRVLARGWEFDFHDGGEGAAERHDCFRYWAHNPHVMQRSLKARGLNEDEIDEFMAVMLYRKEGTSGPGIPRDPGR